MTQAGRRSAAAEEAQLGVQYSEHNAQVIRQAADSAVASAVAVESTRAEATVALTKVEAEIERQATRTAHHRRWPTGPDGRS